MKRQVLTYSIVLAAMLTGCADPAPTVGKLTELAQVCDRSNDGQRIAVAGYLKLPDEIPVDNDISVLLEIRQSQDVKKLNNRVGVWTSYGTEPNQVAKLNSNSIADIPIFKTSKDGKLEALPTPYSSQPPVVGTYTHASLHVTTNDGKPVTYTDRVRVSGKVGFPTAPGSQNVSICTMNNPLIERIP